MRALFADATFTSKQRRDNAVVRIRDEAATRGLIPYAYPFSGGTVSGVQTFGNLTLRCSYQGPDAVIDQATDDLYRYMDSSSFEGTFGTIWLSDEP